MQTSSILRRPRRCVVTCLATLALGLRVSGSALAVEPATDIYSKMVVPFLQQHCVKCHGPNKQSGKVRLDDLTAEMTKDAERWRAIRDQIRDGLMPPAKEPRPEDARARALVAWVTSATGGEAAKFPNQGNLIPHELLFGKPAEQDAAPNGRVWRLSPDGYVGFVRDLGRGKGPDKLVQPFTLIPERGIKDFAGLYTIDEPSTEILLRNAEAIVEAQTGHVRKDGKLQGTNGAISDFIPLMNPDLEPTRKQLEAALQTQFRLAIGRAANEDEVTRFVGLYDRCVKAGDRPGAAKTMLQAILLRTDAMYRSEIGQGKSDGNRRLLAPNELALAVSLALGERREAGLLTAAQKGDLSSKEQVAAHVRRILDDPKIEKPRLLKFFREYFEYGNANNVFKDNPATFKHVPGVLVSDTDRLIEHILAEDKDVFRRLLTTPDSFVNYTVRKNKKSGKVEPERAVVVPPPPKKAKDQKQIHGPEYVYGVADWPALQPAPLPKDTRIGVLMQPSWLVAFSTNFDNDPVRRGRWIRERLLGGTVPDLPIGVAAQVPDEPHRTFRDRLTVTRDARCWKCHNKMDELGLPFESFDHFGRFRTTETVRDLEATAKNLDPKGKPLGPVTREAELNTSGWIGNSGDPKLDGDVKDPRELIRKLADSERVRQVFVRHAFRFYLGRNETLADARTLQNADRAYVDSGGSFKALVVALLTSDSFLYRAKFPAGGAPSPATAAKTSGENK